MWREEGESVAGGGGEGGGRRGESVAGGRREGMVGRGESVVGRDEGK